MSSGLACGASPLSKPIRSRRSEPLEGFTKQRRTKGTKAAATREQERGQPEAAAAAVICFEWLQRPENVLAGYLRWTDYRSKESPSAIKIEHHKTGAVVWHPLEEATDSGIVRFYEDAEAVLARLPRRGVPMILRDVRDGITELEEAELTDGQGRALSAHKSQRAYEGYAKRTMGRALSATRKRHEPRNDIQNEETAKNKIGAK
jgi:hypothetical protein